MQRPRISDLLVHLSLDEIRALAQFRARYALEANGFTRSEAEHLLFVSYRFLAVPARAH